MRRIFTNIFCLCAAAGILSISTLAQSVVSGDYDSLRLAADSDGVLTGYFRETTGQDEKGNPRFTCTFILRGERVGDGLYKVHTWHPEWPDEVIEGELVPVASEGRRSVKLKLFGEHGGCWNVAPMLKDEEGVDFDLTEERKWMAVRMVSADRSYFHSSADAKAKQKAYVVKNDPVAIYATNGQWVDAEFLGDSGRRTRGWILTATLHADRP